VPSQLRPFAHATPQAPQLALSEDALAQKGGDEALVQSSQPVGQASVRSGGDARSGSDVRSAGRAWSSGGAGSAIAKSCAAAGSFAETMSVESEVMPHAGRSAIEHTTEHKIEETVNEASDLEMDIRMPPAMPARSSCAPLSGGATKASRRRSRLRI